MLSLDNRLQQIRNWIENDLQLEIMAITPASSDASFRRYFRIQVAGHSYIVMDAPPKQEDLYPVLKVTHLMQQAKVNVPTIYQQNIAQGFLLIEDFGKFCCLDKLNPQTAPDLYQKAMNILLVMQHNIAIDACRLPSYDSLLFKEELELFRHWFLQILLKMTLSDATNQLLEQTWLQLIVAATEQPQFFVHRDFHSRNLMWMQNGRLGVIDFQDAMVGPLTYDLVSLLRDCYITWPKQQVLGWVDAYHQQLIGLGLTDASREQFGRWFDLMGMQRHLKAIGIFARLKIRDSKPNYVKDIPRTMDYITQICQYYPEFDAFHALLKEYVLPIDYLAQ